MTSHARKAGNSEARPALRKGAQESSAARGTALTPNTKALRATRPESHCTCGGSCPRCRDEVPAPAGLKRSQAGDAYEREAERIADAVMARAPASNGWRDATGADSDRSALRSLESLFGSDFSEVRIHADSAAAGFSRQLDARAYTVGADIYFAAGQFQPHRREGQRLLAHELTHVIQQGRDGPRPARGGGPGAAVRSRSAAPFLGRSNSAETSAVMGLGTTFGAGLQFWPLQVTSTRIGPVAGPGGLINDRRNRLSVIIAPTLTLRQLAARLLPLWNSAEPFTPEGGTTPVVSEPVTADELARSLLYYNRSYLRMTSEPAVAMGTWAGGLRFPLPVLIGDDGVATVNRDTVRAMNGGFEAEWEPLLDQAASTVATPAAADLESAVTAFMTERGDNDWRGLALAVRTLTNPIEARPFVIEVLRQAGTDAFDVALGFMDGLVNRQLSLIASQRDGAAVIASIRSLLDAPPQTLTEDQQASLNRSDNMFAAIGGIAAREPPVVATSTGISASGGTPFAASQLSAWGTAEQTEFKRAVYSAHVASAQARGREFHTDVPADQLTAIEGGGSLQRDAAPFLTALLAQARADLATATTAGDALAVACTAIGVGSSYRSASQELRIWENLFPQYYEATAGDRAAAEGGEHGPAAVRIMVRHYSGRKAAPGFGNHTLAVAVDFSTTQGGASLGASTSQESAWRAGWLHQWLEVHAGEYHFHSIPTEAWHWEYRP